MKTRIVEVKVPVRVPLDRDLTRTEGKPARPPANCVADGVPTLCNRELADWLLQYDAALDRVNARVLKIESLQPKESPDGKGN